MWAKMCLERQGKDFKRRARQEYGACRKEGRSFNVTLGLKQGCVMSPWLFNLFMDGVMREWRVGIMNAGVCLNEIYGRQRSMSSFLSADDAVLIVKSAYRGWRMK